MNKSIPPFLKYAGAFGHPYVVSRMYKGEEVIGSECSDIDRAIRSLREDFGPDGHAIYKRTGRTWKSRGWKKLIAFKNKQPRT